MREVQGDTIYGVRGGTLTNVFDTYWYYWSGAMIGSKIPPPQGSQSWNRTLKVLLFPKAEKKRKRNQGQGQGR
jgi:hypothetical protein